MYLHSLIELSAHPGTIIVPNTACARLLRVALDQLERQRDLASWQTADAVAWSTYLTRCFEQTSLRAGSSDAFEFDFVLSAAQERAIWEAVISRDSEVSVFAPEQTAAFAQAAWSILHAWCGSVDAIFESTVSDDVAAFARWVAAYRERTAGLRVSDQAQIMARLAARDGEGRQSPIAHGFLEPAPGIQQFFDALGIRAMARLDPSADGADFRCRAFPDREAEIYAAMQWAVTIAAAHPQARVVVSSDGLQADRLFIQRCADDVLDQYGASVNRDQVYFGAVEPLLHHPLVRDALRILEFSYAPAWDACSALIRSPYIAGAHHERFERALFDEELRALDRYELPVPFVMNFLAGSAHLCKQFRRLFSELARLEQEAPSRQRLVQWLDHFDRCLRAAGWPGDGDLTPATVAILRQWADACDHLNHLDAVLPPVSKGEAVARLRRVLGDADVRETPADPRIFVVSPEQACVLRPTHLWLAGASRDAFVAHVHPSPLLPFELQRSAGVPGADAKRDLYRARRLIETLALGVDEPVASYCVSDGDLIVNPSPLIAGLRGAELKISPRHVPDPWRRMRQQASASTVVDQRGPQLKDGTPLRGGVAGLAAQAACPFQAFARHRLTATALTEPRPGIDMRHKGQVLHHALATLWLRVQSSRTLAELDSDERERVIREAISENFAPLPFETTLERELRFVERERLAALLDIWLDFESTRPPFTVVAVEQPATVTFEGLKIRVRVDRVDHMADGQVIIIDYKTGRCRAADWEAPRLNQPQLPFYALTFPDKHTSGIAFAKVDRAEPRWIQEPSEKFAQAQTWAFQCETWRDDLAALAAGIRDGDARLDPKLGRQTCRLCEMRLLCRIAELNVMNDSDGEPDG